MSHIGKFNDAERKSINTENRSNKTEVAPKDKEKLNHASDLKDRYSKMSDKDFDKYIKSLDRDTAPNNLIDDGKDKKRNNSPLLIKKTINIIRTRGATDL